jgi:DNA-directed RNA polymerase subunit beta
MVVTSRSLVYSKLYEARGKTGQNWLFNPNSPGKIRLFDGRTGQCFKQPVRLVVSYILKLVHQVDDKLHARSTGPYSLVTQQPLRGVKTRWSRVGNGGMGFRRIWCCLYLARTLTIKSDAMHGREQVIHYFFRK